MVCPLIAGLTYSLGKLSENCNDYYLTLGAISPDFQKNDPNIDKYAKSLYNEVIFSDTDFEHERERLQKEQDKSFMDFYRSRKEQQSNPDRSSLADQKQVMLDSELSPARNNNSRQNLNQASFQKKSISGFDGMALIDTMDDSNPKGLVQRSMHQTE